jgi:hypothetical protein
VRLNRPSQDPVLPSQPRPNLEPGLRAFRTRRRSAGDDAVIFIVVVLLGFPLLTMWRISPVLQRYYTAVYANSCAGSAHLPLVPPYIQWANGARTLASGGRVFALAPAPSGAPRFTLSDASVRMGARRLEFVRVAGPAVAQSCVVLGSEIQSHQASLKTGFRFRSRSHARVCGCIDRECLCSPPQCAKDSLRTGAPRARAGHRSAVQSVEAWRRGRVCDDKDRPSMAN